MLPAKLLLCNIYRCIRIKNSWHSHVKIDKHAKNNLYWWLTALDNWNGVPLCIQQSEIQLECDASASGWGATMPSLNIEASGTWNKEVSFRHSNYRELLIILIAIQSFKKELRGKSVQILTDNVVAAAYVNHLGGKDLEFNKVVNTIFAECHNNKIRISA